MTSLAVEKLITFWSSVGGMGFAAILLCSICANSSKIHPKFIWWFWRLGLLPVASSAFAFYIWLTPRASVAGSNINYGRLDFFAIISWGLFVPIMWISLVGTGLLVVRIIRSFAK